MKIEKYRSDYLEKEETKRRDNTWKDGIYNNCINLHLGHLAASHNRLVILGLLGSGKSIFVKYLAHCLAGENINLGSRKVNLNHWGGWTHGALTPIYLELRPFVLSKHFPSDVNEPVTSDHLWAYITNDVLGDELHDYASDLLYDLEHGHAVLMLDGLDEVPYPEGKLKERQVQLIGLARSLNTRYAASRIIIASRPYAYEGWKLPEFDVFTIAPYEDIHRWLLASRLYIAAGLDATSATEKAQNLVNQLQPIDAGLKDRPMFVTLMANIALKAGVDGLPTRRGELYHESIMLLLDRWTRSKPGSPSLVEILGDQTIEDLYVRLAALAYDVHSAFGEQQDTPEISESDLYKHLKPLGRSVAADLIPYLSENAGVLVSPGQNAEKDVLHFAHRTFQEYLAASYLLTLCDQDDSFLRIRDLIMSKPQAWRVPCTLAGDVLADEGKRGKLWDLLDDLLPDDISKDTPSNDPIWWAVWLAATIIEDQKLYESAKLRTGEKAVQGKLLKWIIKLLETPRALPVIERRHCGDLLGQIGDPRPGVGITTEGLPDIVWCDVTAGTFLGGESYDVNLGGQLTTILIDYDYKIGLYPVTEKQYQAFVDAEDRNDDKWWIGAPDIPQGSGEVHPAYDILSINYSQKSNYPRIFLNWYQVVAFCRWLTFHLPLPDGWEIRLPHVVEWDKAARGTDGRLFPYGHDYDPTAGHNLEITQVGLDICAVGLFPNGVSPWGVHDMFGNVRQWCLNAAHKFNHFEIVEESSQREVRGSIYFPPGVASTFLGSFAMAAQVQVGEGFRVVMAPIGVLDNPETHPRILDDPD